MPAGAVGIAWGALGIAPEPPCIVLSLCTFAPRALCMAPRALCIVLRLCTLLQGLCAWSQGLCTWLRGRMQCPGGLCIALGAMYTILGVLYTAPEASALLRGCERCSGGSVRSPWGSALLQSLWALFSCCVHRSRGSVCCCHLAATLRNHSCCRSCCPLPSSLTLPAAGRLHHCHVAASISISAMAAHCLCLRTHQHQPGPDGPAPMAFHSEGIWPAPRGPCHPAVGQALPPAPAAKARQRPCLLPSHPRHCCRHSPAVHRSFRGGF